MAEMTKPSNIGTFSSLGGPLNLPPKCTHTGGTLRKKKLGSSHFCHIFTFFHQRELPVSFIAKGKDATDITGNRVNINLFVTTLGISECS